jgi:tRNA threonylcarbamoyladenosine biosynthesis protein TsaE
MTAAETRTIDVKSEAATLAVASDLARALRGGDVVHLCGDLGTGKTRFAKGLAQGLGLDPDDVRSPTFAFIDVHDAAPGGLGLVHVDLYRLGDASELAELGLQELPGPRAVAAIEWAERLPPGPVPRALVRLTDLGGDRRRIEITLAPR